VLISFVTDSGTIIDVIGDSVLVRNHYGCMVAWLSIDEAIALLERIRESRW